MTRSKHGWIIQLYYRKVLIENTFENGFAKVQHVNSTGSALQGLVVIGRPRSLSLVAFVSGVVKLRSTR